MVNHIPPTPEPVDPAIRIAEVVKMAKESNIPVNALALSETGRDRLALVLQAEDALYNGKPRPSESFTVKTMVDNILMDLILEIGEWQVQDKFIGSTNTWRHPSGMQLSISLYCVGKLPIANIELTLPRGLDTKADYFVPIHKNASAEATWITPLDEESLGRTKKELLKAAQEGLSLLWEKQKT